MGNSGGGSRSAGGGSHSNYVNHVPSVCKQSDFTRQCHERGHSDGFHDRGLTRDKLVCAITADSRLCYRDGEKLGREDRKIYDASRSNSNPRELCNTTTSPFPPSSKAYHRADIGGYTTSGVSRRK